MSATLGRLWLLLVAFVVLAGAPLPAHGDEPRVTTRVSPRKAEAGERVNLTMTIVADEELALGPPTFKPPVGALAEGPSVTTSTFHRTINGKSTSRHTTRISYRVIFPQPGSYTLPSPSVTSGGSVLSGREQKVEITPASGPTGPFGVGRPGQLLSPFGPLDDLLLDDEDDDTSITNEELSLAEGTDEPVFLHARVDKQKVVVGEQVTLSVYLYYRVAYEMTERSEPKFVDFLRYPMLTDPGGARPEVTRVKNRRYGVRLVERVALIPLRAGKLTTGSMSARFNGRQIGSRVLKQSNEVELEVTEPPVAGRPADYVLGNTGEFSLSATVAPRHVTQGGSIAIVVRVEGAGNLPSRLAVPATKDIEWLEPRVRENIAVRGGKVSGHRTFEYAVRLRRAGSVPLGTLRLASFEPKTGAYVESQVDLGSVEVEEALGSKAQQDLARSAPGADDPLSGLPAPRKTLGAAGAPRPPLLSERLFLVGLLAAPLLALLVLGARKLAQKIAGRAGAEHAALRSTQRKELAAAKRAKKEGDQRAMTKALVGALHAAIEQRTGLVARGMRLTELEPKLREAGLTAELSADVVALLRVLDEFSFAPAGDMQRSAELYERALELSARVAS